MSEPANSSAPADQAPLPAKRQLMKRTALIDGIAVLFFLGLAAVWYAADALLLVFACILCAVLFYELSRMLARRMHIKRKFALGLVVLLLLAIIGLGSWA